MTNTTDQTAAWERGRADGEQRLERDRALAADLRGHADEIDRRSRALHLLCDRYFGEGQERDDAVRLARIASRLRDTAGYLALDPGPRDEPLA